MKTKKSIEQRCEVLRNSVLDIIVDNFDYFREHKSHLAWALMNFDLIHRGARLAYDACQDNANDLYRKVAENMSEEDVNLFSDAWDITQMESEGGNYRDDFDPKHPVSDATLAYNKRKSRLLPNEPKYTYNELVERASYEDCGTPSAELAGYTRAQKYVKKDIREKILKLTQDPLIAGAISKYKELGRQRLKKERKKDRFMQKLRAAEKRGDMDTVHKMTRKLILDMDKENEE